MSSKPRIRISLNEIDKEYMRLCVNIAKSNIDPVGNKSVGCILLSDKLYTGNRWTFIDHLGVKHKTIHAEQFVLNEANETKGASLYVTMEPCTKRWHNSKNWHYPSCCELIIKSEIENVYIGTFDKNFGEGGASYLSRHGINVFFVPGFEKEIAEISKHRVEPIVEKEFDEFIKSINKNTHSDSQLRQETERMD